MSDTLVLDDSDGGSLDRLRARGDGPDIGILVLSRTAFFREHYLIHRLMEEWAAQGLEIDVTEDPRRAASALLPLCHVDATKVPPWLRISRGASGIVLNGRVSDISKRVVSRHLVAWGDGYDGPVIVKTDLNCGGIPELMHGATGRLRRIATSLARRYLPWTVSGVLAPNEYKVYPHAASVPWSIWRDRRFVVERYLPEREGDLYCLRQYLFFGDAEINTLLLSTSPVVKAKSVVERRSVPDVPAALREMRRALGVDYGRFDYVMRGGEVVLFDVNRTPAYHPSRCHVPYKAMAEHLATGIRAYVERARERRGIWRGVSGGHPPSLRRAPPRAADGISVIMPARDCRAFIGEAIESVLAQTFRSFELIVSDDGSTDGTAEIAEAYAARDPRVRVLRQPRIGVAANGNACLEAARFDWVARMDADDVSLPHRLERLAAASAEAPEVVLWGGHATHIDRRGRRLRAVRLGPRSDAEYRDLRDSGKAIYVCGPTSMMRRDLALDLGGYDTALEASVDVELMDRMAAHGPVRVVPEELALYRVHGCSISSTRVAAQQRGFRYVEARNLARLEGREIGYADYLRELAARPAFARALDAIALRGRYHYRQAVIHHAEGRTLAAAASGLLALALDPTYASHRLRARRRIDAEALAPPLPRSPALSDALRPTAESWKDPMQVSVVMPSYNSAAFIGEAIDSVLRQTYPHLELLVCDDGSTDGTLEIVEEFARRDDRVRLLRHSFRSVSRNCNAAVAQARHPWIARLDADDVMVPQRLEWQVRAAERAPEVVLWGGHALLVNRAGKPQRTLWTGPTTEEKYRRHRETGELMVIQGPTVMFRRDLFLELGGYDPRFDSAEDLELLSRMAERGQARVLPRVLTLYRVHGDSVTAGRAFHQARLLRYVIERNKARLAGPPAETLEAFVARLDSAPPLARALERLDGLSRQHYRNASLLAAEGRKARAAGSVVLAMALNPLFSLPRIRQRLARAVARRTRAYRARIRRLLPWGARPDAVDPAGTQD